MRDVTWAVLTCTAVLGVLSVGCGSQLEPEVVVTGYDDVHGQAVPILEGDPMPLDAAWEIARASGVDESAVVYAEMLPYVVSEAEAVPTWGFVEADFTDADTGNALQPQYRVTYIDQWTLLPLGVRVDAPDNIIDFLQQTGIDDAVQERGSIQGSDPNTYNSFPSSWRLPQEYSNNNYLTCGYGCYKHTGLDKYATDWDPGNAGHLIEAPASGWVLNNSYVSGYGHQLLVQGSKSDGNGREFYYRIAHMQGTPWVKPGWWIGKGRDVGTMGNSGCGSCGHHIHYVVYRAKGYSGAYVTSGEGIPITKWPNSSTGICGGKLNSWNMYTTSPIKTAKIHSNGCP